MAGYYHSLTLPWSQSGDEDRRFRTILVWSALAGLILSVAIPFLPLSEIARDDLVEVPPRLARLILERQEPPPRVEVPKPKPEPEKEPEPKPQLEKPKKVEVPKKVVEKKPVKQTANAAEKAREKAQHAGILAFQDTLADLRDTPAVNKVNKTGRVSTAGQKASRVERSMITSQQAAASSGGINTASLSRDTGDVGLTEHATATVASPVQRDVSSARETRKGRKMSRTMEEIQMVFDRNKGAIYAMYNRALREDPSLQGKLVLRLTISPSGKVITCELVSNELGSQELGRKVVQRVKLFSFGAKDVDEMTVTYPIDFLPA